MATVPVSVRGSREFLEMGLDRWHHVAPRIRFFPFWRDRILAEVQQIRRSPTLPVIASASEAIHFTA